MDAETTARAVAAAAAPSFTADDTAGVNELLEHGEWFLATDLALQAAARTQHALPAETLAAVGTNFLDGSVDPDDEAAVRDFLAAIPAA